MTGPTGGVLYVTPESARHLADLEHDLTRTTSELAAYRDAWNGALDAVAAAFRDLSGTPQQTGNILTTLIDSITAAAPAPADTNGANQ